MDFACLFFMYGIYVRLCLGSMCDDFGINFQWIWDFFLMGLGLMLNGLLMGFGKGVGKWKERKRNRECVCLWSGIYL